MVKVKIDWYQLRAIAKESAENYEILRAAQPGELKSLEEVLDDKGYAAFEAVINDPTDLPDFVFKYATWEPVRPLKFLQERVNFKDVVGAMQTSQVHLPGNELLKVRKVQVREDYCTDALQNDLDEGWRIIAVCPQASRRPDYILGKYD